MDRVEQAILRGCVIPNDDSSWDQVQEIGFLLKRVTKGPKVQYYDRPFPDWTIRWTTTNSGVVPLYVGAAQYRDRWQGF